MTLVQEVENAIVSKSDQTAKQICIAVFSNELRLSAVRRACKELYDCGRVSRNGSGTRKLPFTYRAR